MDANERIYVAPKGVKSRKGDGWFWVMVFACAIGWLALYGLYKLVHG